MASLGDHVPCPNGTVIHGRYHILSEVGRGNFAKVYQCADLKYPDSKYPVALKVIKREYASDAAFERDVLKHIARNDPMAKQRCVRMLNYFAWEGCPCIVFALCGPTLRSRPFGVTRGRLAMSEVRRFMRQMLNTFVFLHSSKTSVVHTDLKPDNILLDAPIPDTDNKSSQSSRLQTFGRRLGRGWIVADFGSASIWRPSRPESDLIATRPYRAPEVLLGLAWGPASDIWSLGCILFELVHGGRLFEVADDAEHLALIERRLGERFSRRMARRAPNYHRYFSHGKLRCPYPGPPGGPPRSFDTIFPKEPMLLNLLKRLLALRPEDRITAKDALNHPFIKAPSERRSTRLSSSLPLSSSSCVQSTEKSSDALGDAPLQPLDPVPPIIANAAAYTAGATPTKSLLSSTSKFQHDNTTASSTSQSLLVGRPMTLVMNQRGLESEGRLSTGSSTEEASRATFCLSNLHSHDSALEIERERPIRLSTMLAPSEPEKESSTRLSSKGGRKSMPVAAALTSSSRLSDVLSATTEDVSDVGFISVMDTEEPVRLSMVVEAGSDGRPSN